MPQRTVARQLFRLRERQAHARSPSRLWKEHLLHPVGLPGRPTLAAGRFTASVRDLTPCHRPAGHYTDQGDPGWEPILFTPAYADSWFSYSRALPLLPTRYPPTPSTSVARLVLSGSPAGSLPRQVTLLVWGDRDGLLPPEEQQRLAAAIPGARPRVYPETGHSPHWERPSGSPPTWTPSRLAGGVPACAVSGRIAPCPSTTDTRPE